MRPALMAIASFLALAGPAQAETRVGSEPLRALAVDADSQALVVTDTGSRTRPFGLWRSGGRRARRLDTFGTVRGETPDIAATDDGVAVSWAVPVSGGARLHTALLERGRIAAPEEPLFGTGPPRLALSDGLPLLAFPDATGNAALGGAATATLTHDAPERRHLPMDLVVGDDGPLLLDLVQRPRRSQLIVRGSGAPSRPAAAVAALRHLSSSLAADSRRVAVVHRSGDRAHLSVSTGGGWSRRRLPGSVLGTPSVVIVGGVVHVAYSRRWGRRSDVIHGTLRGGRLRTRRLTVHGDDDREPHVAAGPAGELYVGWTRGRGAQRHAMLERIA